MAPVNHLSDAAKHTLDALSIGSALMALLGVIPHLTAVAGLVWFCLRIYQTLLEIRLKRRELGDG